MQTYESLEDITVYIFFKILETEDYTLMIKDEKINKEKLTEFDIFELEEGFKKIIYEYSAATQNFKILSNMKKRVLIKRLEIEYNVLKSVLDWVGG